MAALFPADCRICTAPLTTFSRLPVCSFCLDSMVPMRVPACSICGERLFSAGSVSASLSPSRNTTEPPLCGPCRSEPPAFTRAVAYGSYDGALRELIQLLKYSGVRPAAGVLGGMLAQVLLALNRDFDRTAPVVVAVPLHSSKLRSRGFNQSEAIARAALRQLHAAEPERGILLQQAKIAPAGNPGLLPQQAKTAAAGNFGLELNARVLARVRETQSQTGLTRAQRKENVRGAFTVLRPDEISDRDILLLDDVFTTGTTVGECARVLRQAGAKRIFVATVARVFAPEAVPMPEPQRLGSFAAHA